jgi:hypothetical protein
MKTRKPVLVWLFTFITGGIYFLYWLFSLIEEINIYNKEEKINFRKLILKFSCILSVFVILFSIISFLINSLIGSNEFNPILIILFFICWAFGIYWIVLIVITLRKISIELQQIQIKNNVLPIDSILTVVLFFFYFIGIIYLQNHINKTIKNIGEEKVNTNKSLKIALIYAAIIIIFCGIMSIGLIKNVSSIQSKEPIISINIASDKIEEKLFFDNSTEYSLWVDCDFEYYEGFSPLIIIVIKKEGLEVINKEYDPLKTSVKTNMSTTRINDRVKNRFRGRLDKIDLELGEYEIIVNTFFDEKLIQLNKYIFYVQ